MTLSFLELHYLTVGHLLPDFLHVLLPVARAGQQPVAICRCLKIDVVASDIICR